MTTQPTHMERRSAWQDLRLRLPITHWYAVYHRPGNVRHGARVLAAPHYRTDEPHPYLSAPGRKQGLLKIFPEPMCTIGNVTPTQVGTHALAVAIRLLDLPAVVAQYLRLMPVRPRGYLVHSTIKKAFLAQSRGGFLNERPNIGIWRRCTAESILRSLSESETFPKLPRPMREAVRDEEDNLRVRVLSIGICERDGLLP